MNFGKLVIFGVGLIGGSVALALKEKNAVAEVVGIGRTLANLEEAIERNIIDRALTLDAAWAHEVADANIVLIAAPVAQTRTLLERILPAVNSSAIITDAGSTKEVVVEVARLVYAKTPRASIAHFVPAHPIAGTEHSGAAAAFSTLYRGKKTVITPIAETSPKAVTRVADLWETCGATIHTMSPAAHDATFAAVSHLPHILSFALVEDLATRSNAQELFGFAGSGFKDFTRIAASSPEMWRDIALENKTALLAEIDLFSQKLDDLREDIARGDKDALHTRFTTAAKARRGKY